MTSAPAEGELRVFGHPWWEARRLRYNAALVLAGLLAEALYIAATVVFADRIDPAADEFEVTAFTIFFQGLAYGFAMLLANLCYFLGPLSETLLPVRVRPGYRECAYKAGLVFSVALSMPPPLLAWLTLWLRHGPA
jgi:hypothetical protein